MLYSTLEEMVLEDMTVFELGKEKAEKWIQKRKPNFMLKKESIDKFWKEKGILSEDSSNI